jgi:hypothetical protein
MALNKEHGEGNYKASRQYNDATKKFVESGKVEEAAREAAPQTEIEAAQLASAEAEGRRRAKEEDPALHRHDGDKAGDKTQRSAEEAKTPAPGEDRS